MKLIVGIGNPGSNYAQTRHNIGFMAIDKFLEKNKLKMKLDHKFSGEVLIDSHNGNKFVLLKPATYVNLSGEAVIKIMKYYNIDESDVLIIVDDINLETAKLRLREKGSSGGHNGLKNIILHLKTEEFKRVRIGVGFKPEKKPLDEYVLSRFKNQDLMDIEITLNKVNDLIIDFIDGKDYKDIMTKYNTQT